VSGLCSEAAKWNGSSTKNSDTTWSISLTITSLRGCPRQRLDIGLFGRWAGSISGKKSVETLGASSWSTVFAKM